MHKGVHPNAAAWIAFPKQKNIRDKRSISVDLNGKMKPFFCWRRDCYKDARLEATCTHLARFASQPCLKLQSLGVYLSSTKAMKAIGTVQASLQSLVMKSRLGSCVW